AESLWQSRAAGVQVQTSHHILSTTRRQVFTRHMDRPQGAADDTIPRRITLNLHTGVINDITLIIHAEVAGTGIPTLTAMIQHKETLTIDGEIQIIAGTRHTALTKILSNALNPHTITHLVDRATQEAVGIEVAKLDTRLLKSSRAGIGNVIPGNLKVGGRSPQTG